MRDAQPINPGFNTWFGADGYVPSLTSVSHAIQDAHTSLLGCERGGEAVIEAMEWQKLAAATLQCLSRAMRVR